MARITVLGGCGVVGSVAVKTLVWHSPGTEVRIADQNAARAAELIEELGAERVSFVAVDAGSDSSVRQAIEGSEVVLNCVGPFYRTVRTVLAAVLESRIPYVDVCDDVDVTLDILAMDHAAKRAGITALIGMGASPGVTNLFAKLIATSHMDVTESIDIFHCHGGEPSEGPGVIGHRFHCMSIDIPMFLDGELRYVDYFGEDGIALRQTFDFPILGRTPLYPYPHPEQVTLPRYLDVRQVTNKGSVLPIEYYQLTAELCRLGLASREPVLVHGEKVTPYDFAVAFLIRERERLLRQTNFGRQRGCMSVVVKGVKNDAAREVRVHLFSGESGLGEGTGMPAAIGVMLMQQGKINTHGVLPPEGCIDPDEFLKLAMKVMRSGSGAGSGERTGSVLIETIEADGRIERVEL
ncbi:MAG TPA: saccharopine dehydrogenase NADP-binding domain-containing protein [Terriglobales bacterium]|nr:saccharopine dehydrogenase NADP-binding domain-containing protein [Terriglobales bacterium]